MRKLLSTIVVLCYPFIGYGQNQSISEIDKNAAIDSITIALRKYYVLPEKGEVMAAYLEVQKRNEIYKRITDYASFIEQVNNDIQSVHRDLHLALSYNPDKVNLIRKVSSASPDSSYFIKRDASQRYFNYGIGKVERLEGNITYIDITQFVSVNKHALETIHAAITLNPDPSAFIIDLRENGGGIIDMSRHIISYFLNDSIHLSDVINRMTGQTDSYWTLPGKTPKKYSSTPLYLLTSGNTFSAAEEFAYSLKNLKRAVIIGETTAGGAHGFGSKAINNYIVLNIPYERIENAITKDNWEGNGIDPDISIAASKALEKAHFIALQSLKDSLINADAIQEVQWEKENLAASLEPLKLPIEFLKKYEGKFGSRSFQIFNDELYLQRGDKSTYRMIPIDENTFFIKDLDYRLQFAEDQEKELSLYIIFSDGYRQRL